MPINRSILSYHSPLYPMMSTGTVCHFILHHRSFCSSHCTCFICSSFFVHCCSSICLIHLRQPLFILPSSLCHHFTPFLISGSSLPGFPILFYLHLFAYTIIGVQQTYSSTVCVFFFWGGGGGGGLSESRI